MGHRIKQIQADTRSTISLNEDHLLITAASQELALAAVTTVKQALKALGIDESEEPEKPAHSGELQLDCERAIGRVVGRRGATVTALEQATGTQIIIDKTPPYVASVTGDSKEGVDQAIAAMRQVIEENEGGWNHQIDKTCTDKQMRETVAVQDITSANGQRPVQKLTSGKYYSI